MLFRLGVDEDSEKVEHVEATGRACYVAYGIDAHDDSWSVLVRGEIRPLSRGDERFDVAEINRQYPEIHVFDEDVPELAIRLYELRVETTTGRKTVGS